MFIKIITMYGFLGAWIAYFICFLMYLNGLVRNRQHQGTAINLDAFMQRLYGVTFMNVVTGVVVVFLPVSLLFLNIMPYWIVVSVFSSLVIYLFILKLMKKGELMMNREHTEQEIQIAGKITLEESNKKVKRSTIIFWLVAAINIFIYILLPMDAWDVIPITKNILPTYMPLYLHMMMDWVRMGVTIIGNILLLVAANNRFVSNNIKQIKLNPKQFEEKEKEA